MNRFSNRTMALITDRIIQRYDSYAKLDNFLDGCGATAESMSAAEGAKSRNLGKLAVLRIVLDHLNDNTPHILQNIITRVVGELGRRDSNVLLEIQDALQADGFEINEECRVVNAEILPEENQESADRLQNLLALHQDDLNSDVINHHLQEHERLYADSSYGASVGEARKFVEQLQHDIAQRIALNLGETPELNRPIKVRNYLESSGFLSESERKRLVDGVYGYMSEAGSHPGVTDATVGRMARVVSLNYGVYLLEKWQSWKASFNST